MVFFNIKVQITVNKFFANQNCKTSVSKLSCYLSNIIMSNIFPGKLQY